MEEVNYTQLTCVMCMCTAGNVSAGAHNGKEH